MCQHGDQRAILTQQDVVAEVAFVVIEIGCFEWFLRIVLTALFIAQWLWLRPGAAHSRE